MERTKTRNQYWDLVKGVLIILVITGHVIQYGLAGDYWHQPVFKSIYTFHMPLFMIVSGYFSWSGVNRGMDWIVKRMRQLLLPSFVFAVLLASIFKEDFYPAFWFLCVLFECSVFGWILLRFSSRWWRALWVVLPVVIVWSLPFAAEWISWTGLTRLFPYSWHFPDMWYFFLMGLLLRWRGGFEGTPSHAWAACIPAAVLSCIFFQKEDYVYITAWTASVQTWGPSLFRLFAGTVGAFAILYMLKMVYPLLRQQRWLLALGTATMAVYIIQDVFWKLNGTELMQMLMACAGGNECFAGAIIILLIAAMTACCYWLYLLLRRNRWCALCFFGEKLPRG